jgi:Rha family phage regulatory protein
MLDYCPDTGYYVGTHQRKYKMKLKTMNGIPVITSRTIAKVLGRDHNKVLRDIRHKIERIPDSVAERNFVLGHYINERGREMPEHSLTEEGFCLFAGAFNTARAADVESIFDAFHNAKI